MFDLSEVHDHSKKLFLAFRVWWADDIHWPDVQLVLNYDRFRVAPLFEGAITTHSAHAAHLNTSKSILDIHSMVEAVIGRDISRTGFVDQSLEVL